MAEKINKKIDFLDRLCTSYYNLKLEKLTVVANRYNEFKNKLVEYNQKSDIAILKEYAQSIFNRIDLQNAETNEEIYFANRDYANILVDLLNLFANKETNHLVLDNYAFLNNILEKIQNFNFDED